MASKVSVLAKFTACSGKEDRVFSALKEMILPTRKEKGCINYDLHVSQSVPGVFVFYENWTDKTALDQHLASRHIQDALKKLDGCLKEPVELHLMDEVLAP